MDAARCEVTGRFISSSLFVLVASATQPSVLPIQLDTAYFGLLSSVKYALGCYLPLDAYGMSSSSPLDATRSPVANATSTSTPLVFTLTDLLLATLAGIFIGGLAVLLLVKVRTLACAIDLLSHGVSSVGIWPT